MIDVKETLNKAGERMEMAAMYLAEELSHIRAGRANVAILDGVRVNSYGSMVPLNQVANITTPDARTIAIRPWDKKAIKDIEKAIMDRGVGITPEEIALYLAFNKLAIVSLDGVPAACILNNESSHYHLLIMLA